MQHIFWLVENEVCGRPGPNFEPWKAQELAQAGVGAVLSVNSAESVYPDELAEHNIAHLCVPLAAHAPPEPDELALCQQRLPVAYEFACGHVDANKPVLVHCRHGKDRTGLFMAYYLMKRHNMSVEAAISQVKAVRPIAMTATGWDTFVPEVLAGC